MAAATAATSTEAPEGTSITYITNPLEGMHICPLCKLQVSGLVITLSTARLDDMMCANGHVWHPHGGGRKAGVESKAVADSLRVGGKGRFVCGWCKEEKADGK